MERSNKRSKPNDYYEQGEGCSASATPEDENSHGGQGFSQHSGKGVQNVNGSFHNGRDFNMPHFYNNNVLINSSISPQTSAVFGTAPSKEEHRRNLLESLKFDQIDARKSSIKRAHGKTCRWFIKTSQYIDWLDVNKFDDHAGFLWIKGKPGAGKSTLMKYTFSHVYQTLRKGNIVLSFFFNARGDELEKSTIGLYRSLLSQLLEQQPHLQQVLDSMKPGHLWCIDSLESRLEEALCLLEEISIFCFIDALDECEEQQIRDMLSFLQGVSEQAAPTGAKLHVCLASRHYPNITIKKGLGLVIEGREEHQQDITSYLSAKLNIGDDDHAEEIRSKLHEKASGVFMWVVLVVDILNKEYDRGRKHNFHKRLQDIPDDLHRLIHDILTRDNDNTHGLLLCIQWVLFAKRPLTPKELYFAIMSGVEPDCLFACDSKHDISVDDIRKYIIDNSKGLAESTKHQKPTVQFIHESVRDFLLKEKGLQKIWPKLEDNLRGQSHDRLRRCCLNYMSSEAARSLNIPKRFIKPMKLPYSGKLSHLTMGRLPKASTSVAADLRGYVIRRLPFFEYASRNILYHSDKAGSDEIIQAFFTSIFSPPSDSPFTFSNWRVYNNMFEVHQIRRYTENQSPLYILADLNLPNLIRILDSQQSCFAVEEARYGTPIFAALATQNHEAVHALLKMQVRSLKPDSSLHKLCDDFSNSRHRLSTLSRGFRFLDNKKILLYLIEEHVDSRILNVYLATENIDFTKNISSGYTPLEFAIVREDEFLVRIFLDYGANPNAYITINPLRLAAKHSHGNIISLLLDKGASVNGYIDDDLVDGHIDPVTFALNNHHTVMARILADRGTKIENVNEQLSIALRTKYVEAVEILIDRWEGIDFNTALLKSLLQHALDYRNIRILRLVFDQDPDIILKYEDPSEINWIAAARDRREQIIRLLIDHGINVNGNGVYPTPLYEAASNGHEDIVQLLLDHGADVEGRSQGVRSIHKGFGNSVYFFRDDSIFVEASNWLGESPLVIAARHGHEGVVKMLLSKGADVNACSDNYMPLHAAVMSGSQDIIRLLIERGAEVNCRDRFMWLTPLMQAVRGSVDIVRLLLSSGADAMARDDKDRGLLSMVTESTDADKDEIIRLLKDHGAIS